MNSFLQKLSSQTISSFLTIIFSPHLLFSELQLIMITMQAITFKSTYPVCHWCKHLLLWFHPWQLSLSWFQSWHHWLSWSGFGFENSVSSALDLIGQEILEERSFEKSYLYPLRTLSKKTKLIVTLVCRLNLYSHYPWYLPDFLFLSFYPVWPLS